MQFAQLNAPVKRMPELEVGFQFAGTGCVFVCLEKECVCKQRRSTHTPFDTLLFAEKSLSP